MLLKIDPGAVGGSGWAFSWGGLCVGQPLGAPVRRWRSSRCNGALGTMITSYLIVILDVVYAIWAEWIGWWMPLILLDFLDGRVKLHRQDSLGRLRNLRSH